MPADVLRYVLVTPVRNEAAFIEKTIESVVNQTVPPVKWVIVSDGSTDGTDGMVRAWADRHPWIGLVTLPARAERHFAGKIAAFKAGVDALDGVEYDAIGNLDGDVSFDTEYFAFLVEKLALDRTLGLVGTPYRDPLNEPSNYQYTSIEHVTGPCQLFRRECYEAIGGYVPAKGGAVDRIADIAARMRGWKTRSYTEKTYVHYRHTGTAQQHILMAKFREGAKCYSVGSSAAWELFRTIYQMTNRPFVVGSLMSACGFVWATVRGDERPVSPEMVAFCRREQMQRLKAIFTRPLSRLARLT